MIKLFNYLESIRRRTKLSHQYRSVSGGEMVLKDREAGLFSIYMQALGALSVAQRVGCSLKLDFTATSYYCPNRSENSWWTYYYVSDTYWEHNKITGARVVVETGKASARFAHLGNAFSRHQAGKLSKQFILKPEITKLISAYTAEHFSSSPVVGIHYRGTDKVDGSGAEAGRVSYESVVSLVDQLPDAPLIFLATDEQQFLECMKHHFGSRLLCLDSRRSTNGEPVHMSAGHAAVAVDGYELGLEALLDAYLLAETDLLLRTDSNLSRVSTYIHPRLPVFNLTEMIETGVPGKRVCKRLNQQMLSYRKDK